MARQIRTRKLFAARQCTIQHIAMRPTQTPHIELSINFSLCQIQMYRLTVTELACSPWRRRVFGWICVRVAFLRPFCRAQHNVLRHHFFSLLKWNFIWFTRKHRSLNGVHDITKKKLERTKRKIANENPAKHYYGA